MKQIGIFVDVSNLYYCINHRFGRKLDYTKYRDFVKDLGDVKKCIAYGSQMRNEAHKFIKSLSCNGFEPRFKTPKEMQGKRKSDWDVGIAIDMINSIPELDIMILGSADSDMAPAVKHIIDHGKKVIVFACGVSRELYSTATEVIEITESLLEEK
jgi:uncharacterized protein (TIGR00288 family)